MKYFFAVMNNAGLNATAKHQVNAKYQQLIKV